MPVNSTYMDASWRFESPISWLPLDGILSSTGETKPSASSSSWSKKLRTLKSVFMVIVKSGFTLLSSSDPSSSSYREGQSTPVTEQVTASLLRNRYLLSPHALGNRYEKKWIGRASTSIAKQYRHQKTINKTPYTQSMSEKLQPQTLGGNKTEWKISAILSNLLLCSIMYSDVNKTTYSHYAYCIKHTSHPLSFPTNTPGSIQIAKLKYELFSQQMQLNSSL